MGVGLRRVTLVRHHQVKAIMHQMSRRYRWSVPADHRMPVQQAPISKPLDGPPIQLRAL